MNTLGLPSHHVHWSLPPVLSMSRKDEDKLKELHKMVEDNTLNEKINEVARLRNKIAYRHDTADSSSQRENIGGDKDNKETKEGLLAPSDIRVTYSVLDESGSGEYPKVSSRNANGVDDDGSSDLDSDSWAFGEDIGNPYENFENWNSLYYGEKLNNNGEMEPPRALPSRTVSNEQSTFHRNGDISDRVPHSKMVDSTEEALVAKKLNDKSKNGYHDRLITDENGNLCDLDCGLDGGSCFMEKEHQHKNDIADAGVKTHKRCLCPLGKSGEKCKHGKKF